MTEVNICDLIPKDIADMFYASNSNLEIIKIRTTNIHKNISKRFHNISNQHIDEEMSLSNINTFFADKKENIVYLFHGLDPINIGYIEQNGFDYNKISSENLCGRGFYFADDSAKSKDYSPERLYCNYHKTYIRTIDGDNLCKKRDCRWWYTKKIAKRCMLLCAVNLGRAKITKDARNISQITHRYDSIVLECNKGHSRYREFILEDETRILPLYKIYFTERKS